MFQALQYLLKLCSHPLLVVGNDIPDSLSRVLSELFPASSDINLELHKLHHSPKLVALQEILEECGIGLDASTSEGTISVGQHRVLIFAQHKVMSTSNFTTFAVKIIWVLSMLCQLTMSSLAGLSGHHWKGFISHSHEEVSLLDLNFPIVLTLLLINRKLAL